MYTERLSERGTDELEVRGIRAHWKQRGQSAARPATLPQLLRSAPSVLRKQHQCAPSIRFVRREIGGYAVLVKCTPHLMVIESANTELAALTQALKQALHHT